MIKKQIVGILSALILISQMGLYTLLQPAYCEETASAHKPLQGTVIHTNENNPTINPEDLKVVEKGTTLEMTVSTPLSSDVSATGDEFFSKVTQDVSVDGKVVIPRDTLVHGKVEKMADPKRAGRNGYITTKFDYMITPDGREIPLDGSYSTKDNTAKAIAKVVGRSAGFTLGGGAVGAILVLKYGGLAAVAASHGYALAGGAAVGGAIGLTAAMLTKGKHAMIQPGAELRVKLQDKLILPYMNMPDETAKDIHLDGLTVKVLGARVEKDPFGEPNELTLTVFLDNRTENTFSSFDIALEDEHGSLHFPSPFGDTGLWFQKLGPNARLTGNITFNVDNPKLRHHLVFFKQYTREALAKVAITDAMRADKKTAHSRLKEAVARDSIETP